jgi:hypothetical protein
MNYGSMQRLIPAAEKSFVFSQILASLDLWVPLDQAKGTKNECFTNVLSSTLYAPFFWGRVYQ